MQKIVALKNLATSTHSESERNAALKIASRMLEKYREKAIVISHPHSSEVVEKYNYSLICCLVGNCSGRLLTPRWSGSVQFAGDSYHYRAVFTAEEDRGRFVSSISGPKKIAIDGMNVYFSMI